MTDLQIYTSYSIGSFAAFFKKAFLIIHFIITLPKLYRQRYKRSLHHIYLAQVHDVLLLSYLFLR